MNASHIVKLFPGADRRFHPWAILESSASWSSLSVDTGTNCQDRYRLTELLLGQPSVAVRHELWIFVSLVWPTRNRNVAGTSEGLLRPDVASAYGAAPPSAYGG